MFNVDNFAPVDFKPSEKSCNKMWMNTYGGYIIQTKWDPVSKRYITTRSKYNMPNISKMFNE